MLKHFLLPQVAPAMCLITPDHGSKTRNDTVGEYALYGSNILRWALTLEDCSWLRFILCAIHKQPPLIWMIVLMTWPAQSAF